MKPKLRLFIIVGVEFLVIALILTLIFFAGKKSYTVTFDLDGGTLISGELVQEVTQGGNATPPNAVKDGCYLHSWSSSYNKITRNVTIRAIWEYQTTVGIEYEVIENANYCLISGAYPDLQGEVYVGAFYDGKRVLGVKDGAFENCKDITKIYMLDGIITIGENAFAGCDSLEEIVLPRTLVNLRDSAFSGCSSLKEIHLPKTLKTIGKNAFANCVSLERVEMSPSLQIIGNGAFQGCSALEYIELPEGLTTIESGAFAFCSALKEIVIPSTVEFIGDSVFNSPSNKVYAYCARHEKPVGWSEYMILPTSEAEMIWEYVAPPEEEPVESGEAETEE